MPDFTKGADHLTLDSLTSFLGKNPKGADMKEMNALMQQLDAKFKDTPYKTIVSSFLMAQMGPVLKKIQEMSAKYGDTYGPEILKDVKAGRTDRFVALSKLCSLNCFRLQWAQHDGEPFDTIRTHIMSTYHADVRNPKDYFMYVPAICAETMEIWMMINSLVEIGAVRICETLKVMNDDKPTDRVTIVQLLSVS